MLRNAIGARATAIARIALPAYVLVAILGLPSPILAQRAQAFVKRGESIPKDFTSWSLFLVCNPAWLGSDQASAQRMKSLFDGFNAFSPIIGSKNVAVWFSTVSPPSPDNYDADEAGDYCAKYKLQSNVSPYVVVTTTYPTKFGATGNYYAMSLAGLDTENMLKLLGTVSDRIRAQDFNAPQFDSDRYWRQVTQTLEDSLRVIGRIAAAVKITVNARLFKIEIDGAKVSG
jgi:hypothetical protein